VGPRLGVISERRKLRHAARLAGVRLSSYGQYRDEFAGPDTVRIEVTYTAEEKISSAHRSFRSGRVDRVDERARDRLRAVSRWMSDPEGLLTLTV